MSNQKARNRRSRQKSSNYFTGSRLSPPEYPPVVVAQPWNTATVMIRKANLTSYAVTLKEIRYFIKGQLGFNNLQDTASDKSNIHFELRIQSISVWLLAQKGSLMLQPIDFTRYSKSDNAVVELTRIDSFSQKNMYARVGYQYPLAVQSHAVSTAKEPDLMVAALTSGTGDLEIHLHVLWRGASSVLLQPEYTFPESHDSISEDDFTVLNNEDRLSRIERMLQTLIPSGSHLSQAGKSSDCDVKPD